MLIPKIPVIIVQDRYDWGAQPAKPGLKELKIPVDKVIVTDTRDQAGSCFTRVSLLNHLKL